jgi:hypothetical protein
MGQLRRGDIGGMSAVDPIATDLLHYASGRKGPKGDIAPITISPEKQTGPE